MIQDIFSLQGKKAIVTGGSRGLGFAMASALCAAGATTCIWATSDKVHAAAERLCAQGYHAFGVVVDLSDRAAIERAFTTSMETLGALDILVNNAGVNRKNPSETYKMDDWDYLLQVNLSATFRLCQLAGNHMLEQGHGKIINMASMISFFGGQTVSAYAASKGAVVQMTKTLSNEWAARGVQVNCIAPGYMATDMSADLLADQARTQAILSRIPAGRWGKAEDLQGCILFLASDASQFVTGAVIPVDGGYLAR